MLKKRLVSLGMVLYVLAATGCAAQGEPTQPDVEKQVENTPSAASPEPTQTPTPTPEITAAPSPEPEQTAEPENIFDKIPTEGNVWKINEIESKYRPTEGHSSPDWHPIFHEMTREEVLAYFGMKLDIEDFLPELEETPNAKYGFWEYQLGSSDSDGIVPEHFFSYRDRGNYSEDYWEWVKYVEVGFREGKLPNYLSVKAHLSKELRDNWEPEISVIQGQEVTIARYTVKREDVVYAQYYLADFLSNDLGVAIEALGVEWEDVKKVIEYLVFYAQEREEKAE